MNIIIKKLLGALETQGKYRTMIVLRNLPENQLRDVGVSPELLSLGVKAWPWQSPEDAIRIYPKSPLTSPNLMELHVGKVMDCSVQVKEQSVA